MTSRGEKKINILKQKTMPKFGLEAVKNKLEFELQKYMLKVQFPNMSVKSRKKKFIQPIKEVGVLNLRKKDVE